MKNISLIKVTFTVVSMAVASSLVSANDLMPKNAPNIEVPSPAIIQFDQLDINKDNLLSLVEAEKYKTVYESFTKIDSNDDASISKDEFTKFTEL